MADYKIRLGTELDTTGVKKGIEGYRGKPIEITTKLNTAGIREGLSSYKAKPINVDVKLNTKGLAGKIKEIKPKTPIHLNTKLDIKSINTAITSYKPRNIKLNADLSFKGIAGQITEYNKNVKPVKLDAELNKSAIKNAINQFNIAINSTESKTKIRIKAEPDLKGINKQISAYKVRSPLKVNVKIDKAQINQQIKDFGASKRYITVKAKLDNGAISQAIREYKTNTPIKVGLDLDYTEIDKKIGAYAAKGGVIIPARLMPASKGFESGLTKTPVKINATLDTKDINAAIDKFKPRSKIKANVKLDSKDINAQIAKLPKAVEPIDVGIRLDASKINADIALFQPTATLGIKPDLIIENVDSQISAYVPKVPLKVNVQINNSDIAKAAKKQGAQEAVRVNVQLNSEKLNEQIRSFKTTSRVKVNIKLDSKGVAEQIKKINPKTKIKVGVQIDREDVERQVASVGANTPIRLGVIIDRGDIESQINSVRQQLARLGNVKIQIVGENVDGGRATTTGTTTGVDANAGASTREASSLAKAMTRDFREANIEISLTDKYIRNLGTALREVGFNESSVESITNEFEKLGITVTNVASKINGDGSIRLTVKGLDQFKNAVTLVNNIEANGKPGAWSRTISSDINNIAESFSRLKSLAKEIGDLKIDIFKSNDAEEVKMLTDRLNVLQKEYNELLAVTQGGLKPGQLEQLNNIAIRTETTLSNLKKEAAETRAELAKDIRGNFSGYEAQIKSLETDVSKLSEKPQALVEGFRRVKQALIDMHNAADDESLIRAEQRYQDELKETLAQLKINQAAEDKNFYGDTFDTKREAAFARLNGLFEEGSQASKRFGAEAQQLRTELEQVGNVKGVDNVTRKIGNLEKKIKSSNVQTQTWGTRLKEQFSKYSQYLSIATVFMYAARAARSMFEQVKAIDTAMTELKKVTDETDVSYDNFLSGAAKRAKEIGTTIDGLIQSTSDFARLGYSFEDSQGLAEVANIYAVVGDEIEGVEGATESLISTMAAFKTEMNGMNNADFAMSIIDIFNELGNKFAISSGGLGEALERSASSLAAANNTLHESAALITAANEVVQNPEKVGTAMKTVSMRIRAAKTEMEEMGEDTAGMVESTAKLRSEIMALSGVDIMLDKDNFKSTYQIMDELSQKWENLSDIQQATIIELMAGKHQGNVFASLMENFDTAREALETSLDSSGSAMAEHAKWSESLEARLNKLKAAWQSLSQSFMSSDFLKGALNAIIGLIDGVNKLMDTFGTLPTLIGVFAGGLSGFKNKGLFTFNKEARSMQLLGYGFKDLGKNFGKISTGIQTYNSNLTKSKGLQDAYINSISRHNSSFGKYLSSLNGAKASFKGYIGSLVSARIKTVALEAATIALNMAITMCVSAAIQLAIEGIMKLANAKEELAEKVSELTTKFKEQHDELKKLKGNYDTSNETSMISKYEKLSKGVNSLGENVSLTAEEYSEYQDIVNNIASQIPTLISGYDSQGNALLSVKGNVEELRKEYERLIHIQNQKILTNTGDIEKDFANTIEKQSGEHWWSNGHGFWAGIWSGLDTQGLFGGDYDLKDDTVKNLKALLNPEKSKDEIDKIYDKLSRDDFSVEEIRTALEKANIEVGMFESPLDVLKETLKTDPQEIKNIVDNYYTQFEENVGKQKTIAQAKLSEAFDISDVISDLNYGNISEELQAIAYQTVNSLDYDFFSKLSNDGKTVEDWVTEMLDQLNSISEKDNTQIEAAFDLQTQFNGGEISYGKYIQGLKDVETTIDNLDLKDTAKKQLKLSLGLDDNGVVKEYETLRNRLTDHTNYDFDSHINVTAAEKFLNSLSADELSVAVDIIAKLSNNNVKETIQDIQAAINREIAVRGLTFDLNLEVETAGIESFNTALAESVSATGLSSESISALKSRYADLESKGYDLSAMFEETSNGIHLNKKAVNELEQAYVKQKQTDIKEDLDTLQKEYDLLTEDINNCNDASERASLYVQRDAIIQQINDAATLAAQYEGLTSAYNNWLAAENAGSERDMYENIIKGFETIEDELSRGWLDDGTIKFLELLTGKTDLAFKSGKELKEIYDSLDDTIKHTGYSISDFFTVDEDGNSTNTGVYNFLKTVEGFEDELGDVIERKDGNIVGFNFEVAGGDEAIAEALGVSEELVQIMVRAADDAGFVVNIDGAYTQLADLKTEAENANNALKKLHSTSNGEFGTDHTFNFAASNIDDMATELDKAKEVLKQFKKEDGTFDSEISGAKEALKIAETLQITKDKLDEPTYMSVDTSQLEKDLQKPVEQLQKFEEYTKEKNLLNLTGEDKERLSEIDGELDKISKNLLNLDEDVKVRLGIDEMTSVEQIREELENGTIEIPTELTIESNMDKNLEDLVTLGLLEQGLITEKEAKIRLGLEVDKIDTSEIEDALDEAGVSEKEKIRISAFAEVFGIEDAKELKKILDGLEDEEILVLAEVLGKVDVEKLKLAVNDLDDKTVEAIAEALGEGDVDSLKDTINGLDHKTVQAIAEAFGYNDVGELNEAIENLDPKTVQAIAEALGIEDVDSLKDAVNRLDDKNVEATATVSGETEVNNLKKAIDKLKGRTIDVVINFLRKGWNAVENFVTGGKKDKVGQRNGSNPSGANGTANVNGTTGRAFKQGGWGTKNSGTALVGELGRETLVRDGRYYTIGDAGAEFIKYRKGDIIFNHKQTEELFENGRVTSGGGRAKAFASGTAFSGGSGGGIETEVKSYTVKADTVNVSSSKSSSSTNSSSKSSSSSSTKETEDEFEETFDWIEIKISRLERAINNLDQKANNVYKTWSSRNKALASEISKVGDEIELQQSAYNRYMQEANSVGLSKSWAKKVRNGEVDISTIKDETLAEKIKDYQNWYEKALDCKDAIEKLKETESELIKQRFNNIASEYESKIGKIDSQKSLIEQDIEQSNYTSVAGSNSDNYKKLISQEKNTISLLEKERDRLQTELDNAVENGDITKYSEEWYKMAKTIDDVSLSIKQSTTNISKSYSDMFDEVSAKYDGILQGYEHTETMLNEYISQAEADGHIISKKYYQALIDNEKNNISTLKQEQEAMIKARDEAVATGKIKKGSTEWYRMCSEIDAVTQSIENGTTKLKEYDKTMRDIDWDTFDMKQERISDVTAESDFMIDLMSSKDMHDDKGNLTAQGAATLGLHGLNHNTYMYQADDYAKEIADIDRRTKLDKNDKEYLDPNSKDVINRRRELVELQRESILAAEDEKQAIKDLVQEGIDKELDSLQELIDKKNEALQSEKDLYEYQKKVKEQTEEIASLEKQMAAYENDDSEEARAKIQELKVSLEDAQENLKETEWDKYIQDTSALLDTLYTEYETILNTRLDNIDDLLAQVVAGINASMGEDGTINSALGAEGAIATAIANTVSENGGMKNILNTELGNVGATLSTAMNTIWTTEGTGTNSVLSTYGEGFQSKQTTTNTTLDGIKIAVDKMVSNSDEKAEEKIDENKTSPSSKKDPTGNTKTDNKPKPESKPKPKPEPKPKPKPEPKPKPKPKPTGDGNPKVGDKVKFVSGRYYYDSQGASPSGSKNQGEEVYITSINTRSWATHPYHISTGNKLGSGDLGWLKLNQLSGYASGKKNFLNNEVAWTQENGQEYIIRPSDGAILTPVAKGDSILNATASGNIWSMANNPAEFIKDNLKLDNTNIPNGANVNNTYSQHIDNVVFRMDNVKNYEEMLYALKDDRRFEKLITAMTIDRIAGKSSLAKGKSIR